MATRGSDALRPTPASGILGIVILVVPHAGLEELLASSVLLVQIWPGAVEDVMMFIQVLRMSCPSLADVLSVGLISVLTPAGGEPSPQISLAYRSAVLSAAAADQAGEPVAAPHLRPADVRRLEIADIAVGGRSALRLAG